MPARRFLALTVRLPAYTGAMAAVVAAEQQQSSDAPDASQEMSVDAMNALIPGLIETVEV